MDRSAADMTDVEARSLGDALRNLERMRNFPSPFH